MINCRWCKTPMTVEADFCSERCALEWWCKEAKSLRAQVFELKHRRGDAALREKMEAMESRNLILQNCAEQMISCFTVEGHPGEEALRTSWIRKQTVDGWRGFIHYKAPDATLPADSMLLSMGNDPECGIPYFPE